MDPSRVIVQAGDLEVKLRRPFFHDNVVVLSGACVIAIDQTVCCRFFKAHDRAVSHGVKTTGPDESSVMPFEP